jgi:hypothetical protein
MSIQSPQGVLNIPNATLRVGKLTVDSTAGLDTFINTIQRNTIILEDLSFYTATKQWDIKMPNVWVAAFNVKGIFSFNFRNTVNGTAANGYTLAFSGTTLTLKYNDATLATSTNIPNLDTTYGEVYVTFEKQYISVTIDGTIYLSYKDNVVRPALEGEFINFFNTSGLRLSNIKIVAGNWISDGTSNIFLMGGNLNVNEDALISSNLTVTGNALVSSNLFITGDINLTGNLKQNGSIFQAEGAWTKTGDNISYTTGNVSVGKDITVTGSVTSTTSLTSNVVTIGTTKTFVVTAAGGAFYIDGIIRKPIKLHQHQTYIFDLSSSTLLNNPFIFSESNNFDGTTSGTPYTTGITSTGTKRTFVVSASTPTTLYYYSTNTTLMGATVSISPTAELVVSGRVESTDLTLTGTGSLIVPNGTTAQRPVTAENGMIRYNSTTGSVEAYTTSTGWGAISALPSITSVSPTSVQGADTGTQTFIVQGTGINAGSTVELEGVYGNRYSVFNTTTPAAAGYQISFQMGVFGAANGYDPLQAPYTIRIANSQGVAAFGTATISLDAPTITGLSNNILLTSATGSQVITLTGTGFTSSMTGTDKVLVLGADGSTLYNVDSVTIVSSTSLTFKLSATGVVLSSGQLANRPYKVKLTGIFGKTVTSTATIALTGISWTSPAAGATLATFSTSSSANNTELAATDDVGGSGVTYSVVSANLPSGLTLNPTTGAITGTIGAATVAGGVSVTFRVTDNVTGTFAERTFSIVGTVTPSFTPHTFIVPAATTNTLGSSAANALKIRTGPTFAEMKTAYNTTSWYNDPLLFNEVSGKQGFQLWTIPATGTYRITAKGAMGGLRNGGTYANTPGKGAEIRADIAFTVGTKIVIIAGQQSPTPYGSSASTSGTGGGGATWVLKENFTTSTNDVYMVAGGGGGTGSPGNNSGQGGDASTSSQGVLGPGGAYNGSYGGGGAGWTSDGQGPAGGKSPHNGAIGGLQETASGTSWLAGGAYGGSGGNYAQPAGGGAGATGGHMQLSWASASKTQGGTSYIMPNGTGGVTVTNRTFGPSNHTDSNGSVYIELL